MTNKNDENHGRNVVVFQPTLYFALSNFYPLRVQFLFTISQHLHSIYSVLTGLCPFKLPYGGSQPPLDPANALRAICFSAARKMLRQISNYIRPRRTVSARKRKAQTPSGTTCHLPLRGRLISPPPGVVSTCRWHVGLQPKADGGRVRTLSIIQYIKKIVYKSENHHCIFFIILLE